ncbi:hypothetical protein L7F22_063970 [Adiantum nelumboides]|nr:hypothetical protein [Adiantum nelumboides]
MVRRGDITIGWVKLAALEGCQSRQDSGLSPLGFPDLLPGMKWNEHHNGCVASLSSIFNRSFGRKREKQSAIAPPATSLPIVPFTPVRGTYAYDVLQRKFKVSLSVFACIP